MKLDPNKTDEIIRGRAFYLGQEHFGYIEDKANISVAEVFGVIMVEAFMQAVPEDEVGSAKYEVIRKAFLVFFKVIVHWFTLGFRDEQRKSVAL